MHNNYTTATEAQLARIVRTVEVSKNDCAPFSTHDMLCDENAEDLQKWVDGDELAGIVDESCGGIIGYVNRVHAERIVDLLNAAATEPSV